MWRVLAMDQRQIRELEIYSDIEPIGWDVSVSRPPQTKGVTAGPMDDADEARMAAQLSAFGL